MKKLLFTFLSLCLLLSAVSCQDQDGTTNTQATEARPTVSANEAGIVYRGFVPEAELPANEELTDWYTDALNLETVPASLLYSKDEADGLWHCWIFFVEHGSRDTLSICADVREELCVILEYKNDPLPEDADLGAYYFTVDSEASPAFDLLVNGEHDGLIKIRALGTVAK